MPLGLLRDEGHRYRYHDDLEREAPHMLGQMQVARKDIEKLRHLLSLQKRLRETDAPLRVQRALMHRGAFRDALTWLDIHGEHPDVVEHWEGLLREEPPAPVPQEEGPRRRRRPRRRRGPVR